jgi:RND family efflux transporter MFP subunit
MTSTDAPPSEVLPVSTPSDRRSGPSRWLLAGSIGILVLGGGFVGWRLIAPRLGGPPMTGMPPGVAVTLESVQTGQVQNSSEFIGRLEAQSAVALQPEVSGRVVQVYVSAGDRVTPGTPILLISPEQSQSGLASAQASVSAAQAAQNTAQSQLRALETRRLELEADLDLEQKEYERAVTLVEEGALSVQDLDLARRDLDVAQAALNSGLEEIAAARSAVAQASASLNQAEAARSGAEQDLQDRTVFAPIAGIVGDLPIKLGDYVAPGTLITSITENASLELDLNIPLGQRSELTLGLPVEILLGGSDEVLSTGSITFISPQADADTQTVLVKARFTNGIGRLQDAQQVQARIIWSQEPGVLVPTSAVTRLGGQTFLYVAEAGESDELPPPESLPPGMPAPEQVARLRPVELGAIQGDRYHVIEGISPGETIVVSGILNLQDGTPILPQTDAAPAEPGS